MKIDIQRLLFLGTAIVLGYLVIIPLFFTLQSSFYSAKGFEAPSLSLKNYRDLFSTPGTSALLVNSLWFAIGSSLVALVIGTLLAWIVERTNTPCKDLAYLSAFISFAIPAIIKVIGWILLLGPENGLINIWLRDLIGLQSSPFNIFTLAGMIFVEGLLWTPVVFLFMAAPFRSMDPSLEESASMSGAGVGRTFYHITFKLAMPSVLSVLLLTFVRTIESFEIPALIGIPGGIMVLTTEIYLKLHSGLLPQYGLASAYAIVLILFVSVGLYFYSVTTRQSQKFYTITGKGFRPRLIDVGKWRYLTTALVFVLPVFLILPVLVMLWASVLPYYTKPSLEALSSVTSANYLAAFQSANVLSALKNSLFISVMSATATILLTAVAAWIVIRTNIRGRWLLEHLASFTLVFPGVVLGVALLLTYLKLPIPLYGTIWILIVAYITRYVPYGIRYCSPGLLQINKELEESAQMSGAPWGTVFLKIVIPLMMPSLFAGWIYIFLHSVRELSVAVLLSRPGSQVISVAIFEMWQNGQITEIGAFSISLTAILVTMAAFFHRLSRHYGLQI
ncbi:MAG: iron ABC transporter permease [Deltaproteobacteria bacterium]|nr:iron ABC transporter permease [Deltaproteobacteria bacterium]